MSTGFWISYGLLWFMLVITCTAVILLFRHFGLMTLGTLEGVQRDGLAIGASAPVIVGVDDAGHDTKWAPRPGGWAFVLFAAPDCEPCEQTAPWLTPLREVFEGSGRSLDVAVVVPGPAENLARLRATFGTDVPALAEDASGAFSNYRVRVTPFGFLVDPDARVVAKGLCAGPVRLAEMLAMAGMDDLAKALAHRIPSSNGARTDRPTVHA